jgi:phosphopantetheinyl transferase (holo-ACP synthase)
MRLNMSRFPIPLGLGNDICHMHRIYKILSTDKGTRFVKRILTPGECLQPRTQRIMQTVYRFSEEMLKRDNGLHSDQPLPKPQPRDLDMIRAAVFLAGRWVFLARPRRRPLR